MKLEQFFEFRDQGRQVSLDGIPHQSLVYFEIDMHNTIPHGAHEAPRNGCMLFFNFLGDLARGFANNDEIHFHRTDGFVIFFESLIIHAARELLDFSNCIQNITNTVLPATKRLQQWKKLHRKRSRCL